MYKEVEYYLDNNTFNGVDLSNRFLVSVMKWANIGALTYDTNNVKMSLKVFDIFFNNENIFNESIEYKDKFYEKIHQEFGYSENQIDSMITTFKESFFAEEKVTKFIAIEGIDGSGKTEQTNLLKHALEKRGFNVLVLSFPVYESFFGKQIGYLLSGEGEIDATSVDSKSMSMWYALDRYAAINKINFKNFDFVIFNRYTLSSAVYQSVRNKEDKMIEWIFKLENIELKLPIPDLYIVLDVDVNESHSNVSKKGKRDYLESDKDVYEKSDSLLENARRKYLEISNKYINIDVVDCNNSQGNLKSIEEIHKIIINKLNKWNLLNTIQ